DRKRPANLEVRARLLGQRPLNHQVLGGIDEVRSRARDIEQQGAERRLRLTLLALVQHFADEAHGEQRDGHEEPSNADAKELQEAESGERRGGCGGHSRYDTAWNEVWILVPSSSVGCRRRRG